MTLSLRFDAVAEASPGPRWAARWERSWPAYQAWFLARGGAHGPSRAACEAALAAHMPELAPVHRRLTHLAGDGDLAARFLSTWRPPQYLGGCSVAALARGGSVRLVRNYDLSPDLNEGLLLRTAWTGQPVMGMSEFLWGLSDGVNAAGLAVALAYGGRPDVAEGFGVTTILRYVLETCATVAQAVAVLRRVPSHMAYNITLADRKGTTATVELSPGGGARLIGQAVATNHQHDAPSPARAAFTRTHARRAHLCALIATDSGVAPEQLSDAFLAAPLFQRNHAAGFGTLFTADYDPAGGALALRWPGRLWRQRLDAFEPGSMTIRYDAPGVETTETSPEPAFAARPAAQDGWEAIIGAGAALSPAAARALAAWGAQARATGPDWPALGRIFAHG